MQLRIVGLVAVLASCGSKSVMPVAAQPKSLGGIWLGTLNMGKDLRLQLHLDLAKTPAGCSLDSLDQGATAIPCTTVTATATALSIDVPAVKGALSGTVSTDGDTVTATWTQGGMSVPLVLKRQATALDAVKIAFDPAMPAVGVDKIQSVMDADLAKLSTTTFAPATGIGATIGVIEHGTRRVFSYGAAKPDSVFEIGSVTKTFTGLILAQMVEQHQVRLDEPVRELLPRGTVAAPASGAEITLVDLSAQRSGLPRMPDNLDLSNLDNPYASYDAKALYAYIASHGVAMPAKPVFGYSNVGVGLLGQALADRAGTSYEELLEREITGPLGMHDTTITLTPALTRRFLTGHMGDKPAHAWDLAALAGAGGIRSTAADMLVYLAAQLHPEALKVVGSDETPTLSAAIKASHTIQGEADGGMHIALNWFRVDANGRYWHNGATGGFTSFALFDPDKDFAVVVLVNRGMDDKLAETIGTHLIQRLTGMPATSLDR